jgi:hypothetical protein
MNKMIIPVILIADKQATIIKCPLKIYSKSGCYSCWHCPGGKTGCDNLYWIDENTTIEFIECHCDKREESHD